MRYVRLLYAFCWFVGASALAGIAGVMTCRVLPESLGWIGCAVAFVVGVALAASRPTAEAWGSKGEGRAG